MADETLFGDLPESDPVKTGWTGAPRLREPVRDQIELRAVDLEALLPAGHPARVIWAYIEKLDLSALEDRVQARTHGPGQSPPSPRLLLSLWLYATTQGVGSARALARLCESDDAFRWLCGGVSLNYHGLSDFRTEHPELLERLLIENVASLAVAGVIDLDEVVQDGLRVRASAGTGSFRRQKKLYKELRKAKRLVERLRDENDDDPDASNRRIRAAKERAAREREAQVQAALAQLAEIEAHRARKDRVNRNNKKKGVKSSEPRASTTDPQARVMKMADGGYRPAYNVQLKTAAEGAHIIGLSVTNGGSDRGLLGPALDEIKQRYGVKPARMLGDGGYDSKPDIERLHGERVTLFCPLPNNTKGDPAAPRRGDGPGTIAWRQRMATPQGVAFYRRRFATERPHAHMRNHGLQRLLVRGADKVKAVMLWHVHAFNFLQFKRMGWA
jgi:transposase